jgi:hypothetical protein
VVKSRLFKLRKRRLNWRRRGEDQGSVTVEFVLVLPVLLIILFSLIDFGRLMHAKLQLAEAAREGARAAALQTGEDATNTVDTLVGGLSAGMSPYVINACGNDPTPGQDASVVLTYRFEFLTPLTAFGVVGDGVTLTQTAVMPCL